MNSFKAVVTSAPLLEAPVQLWAELLSHLRMQGAGVRESGAFLLGHQAEANRVVTRFIPYEHLQANALHGDYVSLSAASFSKLWELCRAEGLSVVADVHTHRLGPGQSRSDSANPMVAIKGHIALIVPRFAQGNIRLQDLGMYTYKGNHTWTAHSGSDIGRLLRLTENGDAR